MALEERVFSENLGASAAILSADWRRKYAAALFEADRRRLRWRIAEAERSMAIREHELFGDDSARLEVKAINSSMNALQALRLCFGLNDA